MELMKNTINIYFKKLYDRLVQKKVVIPEILGINNPQLCDIDPYSNIGLMDRMKIIPEVSSNIYYFLREIIRVDDGKDMIKITPAMIEIIRALENRNHIIIEADKSDKPVYDFIAAYLVYVLRGGSVKVSSTIIDSDRDIFETVKNQYFNIPNYLRSSEPVLTTDLLREPYLVNSVYYKEISTYFDVINKSFDWSDAKNDEFAETIKTPIVVLNQIDNKVINRFLPFLSKYIINNHEYAATHRNHAGMIIITDNIETLDIIKSDSVYINEMNELDPNHIPISKERIVLFTKENRKKINDMYS